MGKRASAVALLKKRLSAAGRQTFHFSASRPMTRPVTWRERAAPSPFVPPDVGAHPSEPKAERLRPLAGLASKGLEHFGDRTMTDIIAIALNKLDTDPMNVRKTYSAESVEGLAASILANGVIQNIVVRKAPKGRFFVTAGGRRFAALKLLAERDQIGKDHPVNALVKDVDDATELSLTENVMREDMHPVDQYEAFKLLVDAGKTVADVAARFGVTEIIVRRRLALAKVSPVLLDLFRNDEMDFEQLSAFTLSDDHERQEQVWNSLGTWSRHAHHIKSSLLTDEVSSSDLKPRLRHSERRVGDLSRPVSSDPTGFTAYRVFIPPTWSFLKKSRVSACSCAPSTMLWWKPSITRSQMTMQIDASMPSTNGSTFWTKNRKHLPTRTRPAAVSLW